MLLLESVRQKKKHVGAWSGTSAGGLVDICSQSAVFTQSDVLTTKERNQTTERLTGRRRT